MRVGGEIELLMMPGIVVAKPSLLLRVHVWIDVQQTFHRGFDVHKFPQVQHGTIHKVQLTADKARVRAPFIVRHVRGLHDRARLNQIAELLKIRFNPQNEWLATRPLSPAGVLANDIRRSTQPILAFLPAHRLHSAGENPPW